MARKAPPSAEKPPVKRRARNRTNRDLATPERIAARERRGKALELRMAGASYAQIARQLGFKSHSGASEAVRRAMRALGKPEVAEQLRAMENGRLDKALLALMPQVMSGDLDAINTLIRLSARRARLNGLDVPVKQELDLSGSVDHRVAALTIDTLDLPLEIRLQILDAVQRRQVPQEPAASQSPNLPISQSPAGGVAP